MSFSNPVAKSVGADGTAPGRVWESRLLPALITPDGGWGVVCAWCGRTGTPPTPFFALLFCLLVCFAMRVRGCVGVSVCGWGCVGVMWWDTLEGFRIDWCFRRGLYESEGGVVCQHLVLWNSRADFPCQ